MSLPNPSSKMTTRRARSDVTSAFDVSAVLNLAFLHPGCPTDDKLKEMVVDACRNSRLFIEDHQAGRMPWTQLAAIYGAPPVDASHLANMSSFSSFRNRSALLERAGVPALPRSGLANPRTSHSCNLPSCKLNLPFLCADLLNDVLGGQKFAMKASGQLERALEDCGSIVSGMGLVAKCKCDDWPQCLCPKRHEARKILNASVPGGLNDQYLEIHARLGWVELEHHPLTGLVDRVLDIVRLHPGARIVISLVDADKAHKQLVRHPEEWGLTLQRLGDLIFVSRGSDFGDGWACFLFDPIIDFLVHDLKEHIDAEHRGMTAVDYHGDDVAVVGIDTVQTDVVNHLVAVGDRLVPHLWSEKKAGDWQPLTERRVWGIILNTKDLTLAVPVEKWGKALNQVLEFAGLVLHRRPLPVLSAQQITGLLQWIGTILPSLHPMYCAFYKILSAACDGTAKGKAHVLGLGAPDEIRLLSDLDLLIHVLSTPALRVRRMQPSTPPGTIFIVSDASFWGWCFRVTFDEEDDRPPAIVHGQWTVDEVERFMWLIRAAPFDEEVDWTVNVAEFLPILFALLALESWGVLRAGDALVYTTDNGACVSWLTKYRARSPLAQDLLKLFVCALLRTDTSARGQHIDGYCNHLTDYGSRQEHQEAFKVLLGRFHLEPQLRSLPPAVRNLWGRLTGSSWHPVLWQATHADAGSASGTSTGSRSSSRTPLLSGSVLSTTASLTLSHLSTRMRSLSQSCVTSKLN